jgi:hypothetical protein
VSAVPEPSDKRRGGFGRWIGAVAVVWTATIVMATVVAALLFQVAPSLARAQTWLAAMRPWLVAAQIAALALLWVRWANAVRRVGRWCDWSPEAVDGLTRGRRRIFTMLGVCMLLLQLPRFIAA